MTTYNQDGTPMGGSADSSQLLDLLTVVANPGVYKAKIDALDKATEENKKYIALVGPANEILAMREKIAKDAADSQVALEKAQQDAAAVISDAKVEAKDITKKAQDKAAALNAKAQAAADEATAKLAQAEQVLADAQKKQDSADKQANEQASKVQALEKAKAELDTANAEVAVIKADLLAKHQAFIESL